MKSRRFLMLMVGVLVLIVTGFSVWQRYHAPGLRIAKIEALAEAGRFSEAQAEIERLERSGRDDFDVALLNDLRAKILFEQGRQFEQWNDVLRSRALYLEAVRVAPASESARLAAQKSWESLRNIDIDVARRLFDLAYPRADHPDGIDNWWADLDRAVARRPTYKLFDFVPSQWGFSGSWDWGDPFAVLEAMQATEAEGTLHDLNELTRHRLDAWRFNLLLWTGQVEEARAQLQALFPDQTIPEDIEFFSGNYTDHLQNPNATHLQEVTFGRQLRAEPGEPSGSIVLRVVYEGRPLSGLWALLQRVDGSVVSFQSTSFSGIPIGPNSYTNPPKQLAFSGLTDADGMVRVESLPPGDYLWRFYMSSRDLDPDWADYRTTFDKENEIHVKAGETFESTLSIQRQYRVDFIEPVGLHVLGERPVRFRFTVKAPEGGAFPPAEELAFSISLVDRTRPSYSSSMGGRLLLEPGVFEFDLTEDLAGFDDLKEALLSNRKRSGPFSLLVPQVSIPDNAYSVNLGMRPLPYVLVWLEPPPLAYHNDPLIDYWAVMIRDRYDPNYPGEDGTLGGIPELLKQSPDTPMRSWLELNMAMTYWKTREMDRAQSLLEELVADPLAQGPVSRMAGRALVELTHGKELPSNWRYSFDAD